MWQLGKHHPDLAAANTQRTHVAFVRARSSTSNDARTTSKEDQTQQLDLCQASSPVPAAALLLRLPVALQEPAAA